MNKLIFIFLIIPAIVFADNPAPSLSDSLLAAANAEIQIADDIGGKKRAPRFREEAVEAINQAVIAINGNLELARNGACEHKIKIAKNRAQQYRQSAEYIRDLRQYKHGWEEAVNRYNRLINNIAILSEVNIDPSLSGSYAGRGLIDSLSVKYREQKVQFAELEYENSELRLTAGVGASVKDSTIAFLQQELTELRQKLWSMELKAGVAEADLSKTSSILNKVEDELDHAQAGKALQDSLFNLFSQDEAEVMFLSSGDIKIRLTGLTFESGSAWIASKHKGLLDRLAVASKLYPLSMIKIEGHTDSSGPRDGNMAISQRRSDAVLKALKERGATAGKETVSIGVGPDRPIASNDTEEGKKLNRRIEVTIINGPVD